MVSLIAEAANRAESPINVFVRLDLMRRWHELEKISFDRMIDPTDRDRLHHSDWAARRVEVTSNALCSQPLAPRG
jgi:hypothetical protein